MKKDIFSKFIMIFIAVFFMSSCCVPTKVYANEYWNVDTSKGGKQIYKRWEGDWYIYYQIVTKNITDKRGSHFKNPKDTTAEGNKYLTYYYRPKDKLKIKVRGQAVDPGLVWDNTVDTNITIKDKVDDNLTVKNDNGSYEYKKYLPIDKNAAYNSSGYSDYIDSKYCKVEYGDFYEKSTDFIISIEDKKITDDIINNNGFWLNAFTWGSYLDVALVHFIPYCKVQIENYVNDYKNYLELKTKALNHEQEEIRKIYASDADGYTYEKIFDEGEWKELEEGAKQRTYSVHKQKDGRRYQIAYSLVFIEDCRRLYYKQCDGPTDVTEKTDQECQDIADASQQEAEKEIKIRIEQIRLSMDTGTERQPFEFTDVLTDTNKYKPKNETSDNRLTDKVSIVLTIITNIGMILAVLMIAVLGLKYMLGSVEEKAEYKKDMIPYLVGAILLFGITTFVKVLQLWGESINNI